jgi:hypothetical protein
VSSWCDTESQVSDLVSLLVVVVGGCTMRDMSCDIRSWHHLSQASPSLCHATLQLHGQPTMFHCQPGPGNTTLAGIHMQPQGCPPGP